MNIILFVFIIVLAAVLFIARTSGEGLWPPPPLITNVYTFTPARRGATPSNVAQMWWQPVSYILNPWLHSATAAPAMF